MSPIGETLAWQIGVPAKFKDLILQDTPEKDRGSLIVDFVPVSEELIKKGFDPKALIGEFNLTLRSVT